VPERSNGAVLKTASPRGLVGSNPTPAASSFRSTTLLCRWFSRAASQSTKVFKSPLISLLTGERLASESALDRPRGSSVRVRLARFGYNPNMPGVRGSRRRAVPETRAEGKRNNGAQPALYGRRQRVPRGPAASRPIKERIEKEAMMAARAGQRTVAERLKELGVKGVLIQMANHGQLLELTCEMPTCYCPKGREHFDPWPDPRYAPERKWSPSADHYPTLKRDGGKLKPWNVRLAHVHCNSMDFGWRTRIRWMLEKDPLLSFEEIAETLNRKMDVQVPPPATSWTAELVIERHTQGDIRLTVPARKYGLVT
jgi:hypothetical protein